MNTTNAFSRISGLSEIVGDYDYILCDAWGVLHNGVNGYLDAGAALQNCREAGKRVLVLTNAPRRKEQVVTLLGKFGIEHACFDDIVTSGEATRAYLKARPGIRIYHLGPERDVPIFEGLDIALTDADRAELVCCTGFFDDENEQPEDYDPQFTGWLERGLPMLCANPDKIVERGHRLIPCAGAIAARYAEQGGEVVLLGKPHGPIYDVALARFAEIEGSPIDRNRVLAIGDALETDLRGATEAGLDVLFVTAGVHADLYGHRSDPDPEKVRSFLEENDIEARAFLPHLAW